MREGSGRRGRGGVVGPTFSLYKHFQTGKRMSLFYFCTVMDDKAISNLSGQKKYICKNVTDIVCAYLCKGVN